MLQEYFTSVNYTFPHWKMRDSLYFLEKRTCRAGQSRPWHLLVIFIVLVLCLDPTAHFSLQAPHEPQEFTWNTTAKYYWTSNVKLHEENVRNLAEDLHTACKADAELTIWQLEENTVFLREVCVKFAEINCFFNLSSIVGCEGREVIERAEEMLIDVARRTTYLW